MSEEPRFMPVRIRGVDYPSARAAAEALGVKVWVIRDALRRGNPDSAGVGRGRHSNHFRPFQSRPFEIGGLRFRSMREASVALGFGPDYVGRAVRGARGSSMEVVKARAMALVAKRERERLAEHNRRMAP